MPIFKNGQQVYVEPTVEQIRMKVKEELNTVWEEVKRLNNPHKYYVDLSKNLYDLKQNLLYKHLKDKQSKNGKESDINVK